MTIPFSGDIRHIRGQGRYAALELLLTGSCDRFGDRAPADRSGQHPAELRGRIAGQKAGGGAGGNEWENQWGNKGGNEGGNEGGGVEGFLDYAQQHGLDLNHLWAACDQKGPLVSALLIPCAGRTGMLFVSPLRNGYQTRIAPAVVEALCRHVPPDGVTLAQALLEVHQDDLAGVLKKAGFSELATLLYLTCPCANDRPMSMAWRRWPDDLELRTWDESQRSLFEQAILQSYEESGDCPGLKGVRSIGDIVQGHMSTGRFVADRWFLLVDAQGRPAGVMLLNELPQKRELELVYLGLVPAFRGRGLGRALLTEGLSLTANEGFQAMSCACDAANEAALAMYDKLGFQVMGKKRALIRSLKLPSVKG